jgi:hypothetical protein
MEGRFCPVPVIGRPSLKFVPASTMMVSALAKFTGATNANAAIATTAVLRVIPLVKFIIEGYQERVGFDK